MSYQQLCKVDISLHIFSVDHFSTSRNDLIHRLFIGYIPQSLLSICRRCPCFSGSGSKMSVRTSSFRRWIYHVWHLMERTQCRIIQHSRRHRNPLGERNSNLRVKYQSTYEYHWWNITSTGHCWCFFRVSPNLFGRRKVFRFPLTLYIYRVFPELYHMRYRLTLWVCIFVSTCVCGCVCVCVYI